MADLAYWVIHLTVGLFAFVLSAISVRATVTVLFVLLVELIGLVGMSLPGASELFFTLAFFGGLGLAMGVPLSLGRGKLAWWSLPALGAGVFVALRLPYLFWEGGGSIRASSLAVLVPAVAVGGGLLGGRGLAALAELAWRRMRPTSSRKPS
jgi:hypothetical protein